MYVYTEQHTYLYGLYLEYIYIYIIKRSVHSISRVGSISKWPPRWLNYNLYVYISHKQIHFAYIKTYQVFLSIANSIRIANT